MRIHRAHLIALTALLIAGQATPARPSTTPGGSTPSSFGAEFQINTYTNAFQQRPAVTQGAGQYVVVWSSPQDGSYAGVMTRRLGSSGSFLGGEQVVNVWTTGTQQNPAVAADADGAFVVVWESPLQDGDSSGVFARRFAAAGAPLDIGDLAVNSYTTSSQLNPAVARWPTGEFVVVWQSYQQDGSNHGIFGRTFSSSGVALGTEFPINSYTTGRQVLPDVAIDPSGGFTVVWEGVTDEGAGEQIVARRFDGSGTALGPEFRVSSTTDYIQVEPTIAVAPTGDALVTWQGFGLDGDDAGIGAQLISSAGALVGSELLVNTNTSSFQRNADVDVDPAGTFSVVWASYTHDGDLDGIFAQRYDSSGTAQGGEFQINSWTTQNQSNPAIATDASGNFLVVWDSNGQDGSQQGIFGQLYGDTVFCDGFESGDVDAWSASAP